jgi:CHASE3 domain sensor protein
MPSSTAEVHNAAHLFRGGGLALAVTLALIVGGAASYTTAAWWVGHTVEVRQNVDEWFAAALDAETGTRGYVETGQLVFLHAYEDAVPRERTKAALVKRLVSDNPRQERTVGTADHDGQAAMDRLHEIVELAQNGRRAEAQARLAAGRGQYLYAFHGDITGILADEQRLLDERRAKARSRAWLTFGAAALLAVVACWLLLLGWRRESAHAAAAAARAKESRRRLDGLSELAAALSEARTRAQVAAVIVDHGRRAAGAETCTVHTLDES